MSLSHIASRVCADSMQKWKYTLLAQPNTLWYYTHPSKQHSALTDGQNKNSANYRVLFNFPELFSQDILSRCRCLSSVTPLQFTEYLLNLHFNIILTCIITSFRSSLPPRLIPQSRVLLEKLTVPELVNKFPAFNGTRRFLTVFTTTHYLLVS
jgi:hypothetical protein